MVLSPHANSHCTFSLVFTARQLESMMQILTQTDEKKEKKQERRNYAYKIMKFVTLLLINAYEQVSFIYRPVLMIEVSWFVPVTIAEVETFVLSEL